MQKRLFALIFALALSVAISALPARAQGGQAIGVDVPFAFNAGGKDLPAGYYRIEPANDNRGLWRILDYDHRAADFLLELTRAENSDGDLLVTFHQYGDHTYLAGFRTPVYAVLLPPTKAERALRKARRPLARIETTVLDGVELAVKAEQENRK